MNKELLNNVELLEDDAMSTVNGGGCNWGDAGKTAVSGGIGGSLGGFTGAGLGAGLGVLGYGATCWW